MADTEKPMKWGKIDDGLIAAELIMHDDREVMMC